MDHSVYGYLARQTTQRLMMLLQDYAGKEDAYNINIWRAIREILESRGVRVAE